MGQMMWLMCGFAILIFAVLVYLLSKIIIEKNAQSISMVKILGYSNREINRIYLHSTTIVVLICILLTVPLCNWVMAEVMKIVFFEYSGWIVYYVPAVTYAKVIAAGVICYAVVTFLLNRKVKKIPMSDALKNVE